MPFISLLYLSSISKSLLFESLGRDFAFQYSLPLCIFISKTRYSSNFFLNVSFPSANCILLLKTRLSTPYLLLWCHWISLQNLISEKFCSVFSMGDKCFLIGQCKSQLFIEEVLYVLFDDDSILFTANNSN